MNDLIGFVDSLRSDENHPQVDYIMRCIGNGWSMRQMRARFSQSAAAAAWQAENGSPKYRAGNRAPADLFNAVVAFIRAQTGVNQ